MAPLLSQLILRQRYAEVLPFVAYTVLDIGCGYANLLQHLPQVKRYVGVDLNARALAWARQRYPQHQFYQLDLETQPLPEQLAGCRFETITLIALLEHMAHPERLIERAATLLAPGGRLIITTPTPLGHQIHWAGSQVGLFYKEAADDHKSILDRDRLLQLLHAAQLQPVVYKKFQLGCNQLVVARR